MEPLVSGLFICLSALSLYNETCLIPHGPSDVCVKNTYWEVYNHKVVRHMPFFDGSICNKLILLLFTIYYKLSTSLYHQSSLRD